MQVQRPLTRFWRIANGQEVFGIADEKKMTDRCRYSLIVLYIIIIIIAITNR